MSDDKPIKLNNNEQSKHTNKDNANWIIQHESKANYIDEDLETQIPLRVIIYTQSESL